MYAELSFFLGDLYLKDNKLCPAQEEETKENLYTRKNFK